MPDTATAAVRVQPMGPGKAVQTPDSNIDNKAILDAVPDCMLQVSSTGEILGFKQSQQQPVPLPFNDVVGRPFSAMLPDSRAKAAVDAIARALETGEVQQFDFDMTNGHDVMYFEARVSRATDGCALVIIRDISDRWQSEACDLSLLDIATKVQEERPLEEIISLACRRIKAIFGIRLVFVGRKEAGGTVKLFTIDRPEEWQIEIPVRWDDASDANGLTGTAIRTGKFQVMGVDDPRLRPWREWLKKQGVKTGAAFPLKVGGVILGALTLLADDFDFWTKRTIVHITNFTEQIALAIHVNSNRQRLRLLTAGLEAAANAIVITDRNGRIQWYNPAFLELNGYSGSDVTPGESRIFESGNKSHSSYRAIWQHIAKGRIWHGELVNRRRDGSCYTAEVTITPVRDEGGDIANFISIIQDITQRKQAEKEMMEAQVAVARAERLGALGIMAAGIAHEINQPLNTLKVMADGMLYWYKQGKVPDITSAIDTIREISREADRIDLIIKHMRSFITSSEFSAPMPCDLNKAVEESLSLIGAQLLAHGIEIKTSLAADLPSISGAGTQLEQIVVNLVINAMHALDTLDKQDKRIEITTAVRKGSVLLTVSDNGPGISNELKSKIFDPFFTTKSAGAGMGLGLSIIQSIISSRGGQIQVKDNKPEGGAAFVVEFPVASDKLKGEGMF